MTTKESRTCKREGRRKNWRERERERERKEQLFFSGPAFPSLFLLFFFLFLFSPAVPFLCRTPSTVDRFFFFFFFFFRSFFLFFSFSFSRQALPYPPLSPFFATHPPLSAATRPSSRFSLLCIAKKGMSSPSHLIHPPRHRTISHCCSPHPTKKKVLLVCVCVRLDSLSAVLSF